MPRFSNNRLRRSCLALVGLLAITCWCDRAHAATDPKPSGEKLSGGEETPPLEGILIDRFMIRDLRPAEGTKIRLSFALYAEVREAQAGTTRHLLETRKHRIRNEVLVAIRTCEQHEFQEPGLDRLRRRILLRLRRTIPMLKVEGLLIGEFEFFNE